MAPIPKTGQFHGFIPRDPLLREATLAWGLARPWTKKSYEIRAKKYLLSGYNLFVKEYVQRKKGGRQ